MSDTAATPDYASTAIEIVNPGFPRGDFRAALFDFDGTISLLRRNWQDVMIPMMVQVLADTGTSESGRQLHEKVEEFVMRLNGRQTIYQMIQLADEVSRRGGQPRDPLEYKRQYHDLLWREVGQRVEAVRSGAVPAEQMTVPGAAVLLGKLRERGIKLYLASGTDVHFVRDEMAVLGLDEFFGSQIHGALDDFKRFSKAQIIADMIQHAGLAGQQVVGFGDGFVEIEEVKRVGGLAVGVASEEETRCGVNAWKRNRLIRAGADIIVGDFRATDALLEMIGLSHT